MQRATAIRSGTACKAAPRVDVAAACMSGGCTPFLLPRHVARRFCSGAHADAARSPLQATARASAGIVAELRRTGPSEVALRGGRRWTLGYEQLELAAPESEPVREGGCYLITGGLGGIGITIAEDLAVRARARLVLLSRSGLPRE